MLAGRQEQEVPLQPFHPLDITCEGAEHSSLLTHHHLQQIPQQGQDRGQGAAREIILFNLHCKHQDPMYKLTSHHQQHFLDE